MLVQNENTQRSVILLMKSWPCQQFPGSLCRICCSKRLSAPCSTWAEIQKSHVFVTSVQGSLEAFGTNTSGDRRYFKNVKKTSKMLKSMGEAGRFFKIWLEPIRQTGNRSKTRDWGGRMSRHYDPHFPFGFYAMSVCNHFLSTGHTWSLMSQVARSTSLPQCHMQLKFALTNFLASIFGFTFLWNQEICIGPYATKPLDSDMMKKPNLPSRHTVQV